MISQLFKNLHSSFEKKDKILLSGNLDLDLPEIISVSKYNSEVLFNISPKHKKKIDKIHKEMLSQVERGIPIYGTNTSYGGRASLVLNHGESFNRLKKGAMLSKAIVHVDVSTGPVIPRDIVRAAMLIRINMLLSGHSAIRLEVLEVIRKLLNFNITPIIGQYGTLGASGDLALNGRIVSTLLQLSETKVLNSKGSIEKARSALRKISINPIQLLPKEGLALVNGDNFSTALALMISWELSFLFLLNVIVASLSIQALKGGMRNFHPLLSALRPHPGQKITADLLRNLLKKSKLAFQDLEENILREKGMSIQDPYSIRCLPQYYGPDLEILDRCWETIKINANSVSDNPLWTSPEYVVEKEKPYQWVTGGNFLAMHMAEVLDSLRKIAVHIVKQNDRHLARLVHPSFNNGLPANLSDKSAISQSTFKGLQTQMGMFEVYSSLLTHPVTTSFGTHEEFNQDITSHAFTSGILAMELLKITKYAIATNLIASCQAIDLRGGPHLLSPSTLPFYSWLRARVQYIKKEQPMGYLVEKISDELLSNELGEAVFKAIEP